MKHYSVSITWEDPYPKTSNYRTQGASFPSAVAKAIREFRAANKGRKIKRATIKFDYLGA